VEINRERGRAGKEGKEERIEIEKKKKKRIEFVSLVCTSRAFACFSLMSNRTRKDLGIEHEIRNV